MSGPALLGHLETVHIASDWNLSGFRFPVQWVNRPNNPTDPHLHDFRGLSGQIAGGIVKVGQQIMVLPSGMKSTVKEIWTLRRLRGGSILPAKRHARVLQHDIDVSRGDMIIGLGESARHDHRTVRPRVLDESAAVAAGQKIFPQAHHADGAGHRHQPRKPHQYSHVRFRAGH